MTLRAVKVVQSVVEVQGENEVDAVQARRQKAERVRQEAEIDSRRWSDESKRVVGDLAWMTLPSCGGVPRQERYATHAAKHTEREVYGCRRDAGCTSVGIAHV
jgi:hypothetical protein